MLVEIHAEVSDFLAAAAPFMRSDPFTGNVIAVVAQRAAREPLRHTDCLWSASRMTPLACSGRRFAEVWTGRTGRRSTVVYAMRMYALEALRHPAAAGAAAIADGAEQVVLCADRTNPTSNSSYQSIGFRFSHDGDSRLFTAASGHAPG